MNFFITIFIEIGSESLIWYKYLFCSAMDIAQVPVNILLVNKSISHMQIFWKLCMERCRIGYIFFLAEICSHEANRTFCHNMDIIRLYWFNLFIYLVRVCEWKVYLTISDKWHGDKIIRGDNMYLNIFCQIRTKISDASGNTIDLVWICISEDKKFFHRRTPRTLA